MEQKRELTPAEHRQRVEAARARWRDHAAAAAAGAATAVTVATALNTTRRGLAGRALKEGNTTAQAIRDKAERQVARHARAAASVERQLRSDWPLPAYRRHVNREMRIFDREAEAKMNMPLSAADVAELQRERMRLDTRRVAAGMPRPVRDMGRSEGGFYVAGQRRRRDGQRTVIPGRLQGSMDERLAQGWTEPRNMVARQPLVFPTGDDLREMRAEVRASVPLRHRYFAETTRAKAAQQAGEAAAEGVRGAQRWLRRIPKVSRRVMAAAALGGAVAGWGLSKVMPKGKLGLTLAGARWAQQRGFIPWNVTLSGTNKGVLNQTVATAFKAPGQKKALRARFRLLGNQTLGEAGELNSALQAARVATIKDAMHAADGGPPRRVFLPRGLRRGPMSPIPWMRQAEERPMGQIRLFKIAPERIDAIAARAQPPRSAAEAEAGTYRKGHLNLHGLRIAIETPKGAIRRGWGKDGRLKWQCRMPAHYGYVKGSVGADGDQVDVYLGPAAHDLECNVYLIDQHRLDGTFDEHKAVLGARSEAEALRIYDAGFNDGSGPRRRRKVTAMTLEEFRGKALNGRLPIPLAKAAPTDPTDAPDDGAWPRDVEPDDGAVSPAPTPPATAEAERSLARRLAALFRSWLEQPRRVGDEAALAEALRKPLEDAMLAGVRSAQIPPEVPGLAGVSDPDRVLAFSFERRNAEVERRIEQYSLGRIRAISAETRDTIRAALIAGARMGLPVEDQARRLRDSIGLSPGQIDWVSSYRRQLETLDPRVLGRALRDRRHDGPIARAIETNTPLSAEDIERYVSSYHRRTLAYRATTIARTEALRGANTGMVETARVALLSMPDMTVEKVWIATKDERTRDAHRELDGKVVQGLDEPFTYRNPTTGALEQIRWPHDDRAAAHQVVNCRCTFGLRLVPKPGAGRFIAEAA
jgi:hypothetical protein